MFLKKSAFFGAWTTAAVGFQIKETEMGRPQARRYPLDTSAPSVQTVLKTRRLPRWQTPCTEKRLPMSRNVDLFADLASL